MFCYKNMELIKFRNKNKEDKFYSLLLDSLLSLQESLDSQKGNFNFNEFLLLCGENLEKKGVSVLVSIFSDKKDSVTIRYLNDANDDKRLRKAFDFFFLDSKIKIDKDNYFSRNYLKSESQYIAGRQKDIYRTSTKTKQYLSSTKLNSIACPILIRGELIGFFEFISPDIKKEYLEVFESFVQGVIRSISSSMLFDELRASEEKFRDIFENADEGFYILNGKKKKFVEVNKAMECISGYTKDELLQMNYLTVFSKSERGRIDEYVKHRLNNGDSTKSPNTYETTILCKDGSEKNIKLNVSRYINKNEWFVIVNDITVAKNAGKRLRQVNENQVILNKLLQISINDLDLEKKIENLLDTVIKVPWANNDLSGGLYLLPEETNRNLHFYSSKNFPRGYFEACNLSSLDKHNHGSVIINKKIEVFDGKIKKELSGKDDLIEINSCYIPLLHKNNILGSLCFLFKEKREFNLSELEFFKSVCNIFAGAIDREKNKLELEKSEEKYRELVDNASDMFVMLDLEGKIIFANQSFSSSFPKSAIGNKNKFIDIINKSHLGAFEKRYSYFLNNNKKKKIEFKTKGQNKIIYLSANFSIIIKNGKKTAVQGILRDISDAKIAENKIHETKKHYLSVVDTIRDGIFVVDKNLKILSYNKFFAEKVDVPIEKIKNKKCSAILPGYENNLFSNNLGRQKNMTYFLKSVFITKEFRSVERKVTYKNKDYYYKINISPTKNSKGNTYQAVVTISDITENREAEEEIRRLDEFKNRVLNNVPVSIVMLDRVGKIISLNNFAHQLIGEKLIGEKLTSTEEIKNNKELVQLYDKLINKGKSFKYENLSYQSKENNEKKYLNIIASPLFDRDCKVEGAISIAVDNTEPTIYREKIENLNQNLEKKVKQRTFELDLVNKELSRVLDLKLKFISDASHELRTPLTIMKGNLELLFLDKNNSDEVIEVYRDVEDEILRMSNIISDLTMLTNADSEMEKLHYEEVDLTRLLESNVKSLSVIAKEKNIKIQLKKQSRGIFIIGDEAKLDKVFINLIRNAIKYTDANGWIKIYLNKEKNSIFVKIEDSGIGIPKKDLPNIFERFYRVDKARSRVEGGTGLGLSICKWIVEAHNGTIEVKSEEGRGSEFMVKLPLKQKIS